MNLVNLRTIGSVTQVAGKLAHRLRSRGVARTLYSIAWRAASLPPARRFVRFGAADLFHLDGNGWTASARVPSCFLVRWIDATEGDAAAEYFGDRSRVEARLARGDRCAVTITGRRIGAGVWVAAGASCCEEDVEELGFGLAIPQRAIFTYDGKGTRWGAWGALMAQLPALLADDCVESVFTLIDCNNWMSLDSHRSLGYQRLGSLIRMGLRRHAPAFWIPRTKPFHARRLCVPVVDLGELLATES